MTEFKTLSPLINQFIGLRISIFRANLSLIVALFLLLFLAPNAINAQVGCTSMDMSGQLYGSPSDWFGTVMSFLQLIQERPDQLECQYQSTQ